MLTILLSSEASQPGRQANIQRLLLPGQEDLLICPGALSFGFWRKLQVEAEDHLCQDEASFCFAESSNGSACQYERASEPRPMDVKGKGKAKIITYILPIQFLGP